MSACGQPRVSVVMGVFNAESLLGETMESLLSQEGVDFELVVVNDGSTDRTAEILSAYAARDCRIKVQNQKHEGLTIALMRGCSLARGEFIARQDAGDVSLPGRLKLQADAMASDADLSFVSCWTVHRGPRGELLWIAKGSGRAAESMSVLGDAGSAELKDGPTTHPSVMFRADSYRKVGGYRAAFYFGQDWDLWYRLAEVGTFRMIGAPLYEFRLAPGSISATHKKMQDAIGKLSREAHRLRRAGMEDQPVLDEVARLRPEGEQPASRKKNAAWLYFIGECLRRNHDGRAGYYFRQSLCLNPFSARTWCRMVQCRIGDCFRGSPSRCGSEKPRGRRSP